MGLKVVEEVEDVAIGLIVLGTFGTEGGRKLEEEVEDGKEEVVEEDEVDCEKTGRVVDVVTFITLLNVSILSEIGLAKSKSEEIGFEISSSSSFFLFFIFPIEDFLGSDGTGCSSTSSISLS